MQDLTDGAKNMTVSEDLEKPEKERLDILYEIVKAKKDAGILESLQTQKELVSEADRLEIKTKTPLILAELLFDQNILSQVCVIITISDDEPKMVLFEKTQNIVHVQKKLGFYELSTNLILICKWYSHFR